MVFLALSEPMACLDCQMFLNFYILDLGLDFQSATDIDDPTLSVVGLAQCFSTRGTVRTCADEKNCSADDKSSADKCG